MAKAKDPGKKRGVGRPSLYDPANNEIVTNYCLMGATNEELARFLKVSISTIDKWLREEPAFSSAVSEGKEIADAKVTRSLYHRALGYSHDAVKIMSVDKEVVEVPYTEHYPPDTAAAQFWLKNRRKQDWRDKQDVSLMGPDDEDGEPGPIQMRAVYPDSKS